MLSQLMDEATWNSLVAVLRLSSREADIIRCIVEDERDSAIAEQLGISTHTVHTYLRQNLSQARSAESVPARRSALRYLCCSVELVHTALRPDPATVCGTGN